VTVALDPGARAPAVEGFPDSFTDGLYLAALRTLGDAEDAQDAVQETLARALDGIRTRELPSGVRLGAFVHGIARHVIVDILRRRVRDRGRGTRTPMVSPHPSPLDQLVASEERERVRAAMAKLPARDRDLLRRCFVDGERLVAIAAELGETPESIRKRKSRALERLREILKAPAHGHVSPSDPTVEP